MKPTFKTTALAILVSLGAVACSSTSPSNNQQPKQVQPTNPNSQSKPNAQDKSKKSEAEQNAEEEKAKAEREAQQKAAEQKRLEEEAKIKAEEAKKAKDLEEKARLEREAKEKAEEAKRLEEERIKAEEKAKLEEENRQRLEKERLEREAKERAEEAKRLEEALAEQKRLEEEAKIKAEEAQKAKDLEEKARLEREAKERAEEAKRLEEARIQAELNKMPKITNNLEWLRGYDTWKDQETSILDKEIIGYINIKEAIKNDIQKGGKYAGLHKGSYKSTSDSYYPKVIELDDKSFEHGSNKLIAKKIDYNNKDINYLFINNPYSRYGALFVDRHSSELFAKSFTDQDSNFKAGYYIKDGVEYNMESLQGKTFEYKGNIIAIAKRAIPNTNVTVNDEPTVDGDIAFKIKFKEKADSNEFSDFVINSKILENDIKLKNLEWSSSCIFHEDFCGSNFSYKDPNNPINSQFISISIADKDANDVVGRIIVAFKEEKENGLYSDKLPKNGLLEYQGVFGATKQ